MNQSTPGAEKKEKTPFIHTVYDFLELFVIAICIVFVVFSFALRLCRVSGPSMENTLYNGQYLLLYSLTYTPKQDDIVVFHLTALTKRGSSPSNSDDRNR